MGWLRTFLILEADPYFVQAPLCQFLVRIACGKMRLVSLLANDENRTYLVEFDREVLQMFFHGVWPSCGVKRLHIFGQRNRDIHAVLDGTFTLCLNALDTGFIDLAVAPDA